jgi:hypothetical protein
MRESQKGQENERNIIMNTNNHKILSNQINKVNSTLELLSSSVESSLDNEINIIATIRSSLNHTHRERERERERERRVYRHVGNPTADVDLSGPSLVASRRRHHGLGPAPTEAQVSLLSASHTDTVTLRVLFVDRERYRLGSVCLSGNLSRLQS